MHYIIMKNIKRLLDKKYVKWLLVVALMLILILVIFFKFDININIVPNEEIIGTISNNNILNIIDVIANIVYTISAIVNICIVVHFYKKSYSEDNKRVNRQEEIFWFREVVLKKNWGNIDSYFENLTKINNDIENTRNTSDMESLKGILNKYTKQKTSIQDTFIDFMLFFDQEFSMKIKKSLEDFQDEYTNLVKNYVMSDDIDLTQINELVDNHKTNFYKSIYDYEKNIICKR